MDTFTLHRRTAPLLVSVPHDGPRIPPDIASRLSDPARRVPDTDRHIAKLYALARGMGASMIVAVHSRHVVDLNRAEAYVSLSPGHNTTRPSPVHHLNGTPAAPSVG